MNVLVRTFYYYIYRRMVRQVGPMGKTAKERTSCRPDTSTRTGMHLNGDGVRQRSTSFKEEIDDWLTFLMRPIHGWLLDKMQSDSGPASGSVGSCWIDSRKKESTSPLDSSHKKESFPK
uniref:Uncharacterized protein n=1 Tax=Ascaris lumbricoides TaxID=6252 RepID=A0A9J2P4V7_ASCLU